MALSTNVLNAWGWDACGSYMLRVKANSVGATVSGVDTDSFVAAWSGAVPQTYDCTWFAPAPYSGITIAGIMTFDTDTISGWQLSHIIENPAPGDLENLAIRSTGSMITCYARQNSGNGHLVDIHPLLAPGSAAPRAYACTLQDGLLTAYLDGVRQGTKSLGGAGFGGSSEYRVVLASQTSPRSISSLFEFASTLSPVAAQALSRTLWADAGVPSASPDVDCPVAGMTPSTGTETQVAHHCRLRYRADV